MRAVARVHPIYTADHNDERLYLCCAEPKYRGGLDLYVRDMTWLRWME